MNPRRVAIPASIARPPARVSGEARICGGATMGTSWRATFIADASVSARDAAMAIEARLDSVVAQMSPWEARSDLVRYNKAPGASRVALPLAVTDVLAAALDVAARCGGAYSPACGALTDLWGFGPAPRRNAPPSSHEIEAAKARSDWRRISIDRSALRVFQPGGVALDLCSIAKGHAVGQAGAALDELGAKSWLVDIGGELKARGVKPNGEPWWVALEGGGGFVVALLDLAVATSGVGARNFAVKGRRYSHALDPRTGFPVAHDLAAVSVVHESAMLADAWATALLVLGPDDGAACAEANGLAARFVFGEGRETVSTALDDMLR